MKRPVLRLERDVCQLSLAPHPVESGEDRGHVAGEFELDFVERRRVLHLEAADALPRGGAIPALQTK